MSETLSEKIAEIEALLAKATPGPWATHESDNSVWTVRNPDAIGTERLGVPVLDARGCTPSWDGHRALPFETNAALRAAAKHLEGK